MTAKRTKKPPLDLGDVSVPSGRRVRTELPAGRWPSGDEASINVEVINGAKPGPGLWLSAGIHGDEIIGVEILHRVLERIKPETLRGHVIAVPIVNVFGFSAGSRYLPDRRDLNRVFPGRTKGSMASRLAHQFMTEVVSRCDYGIDFHAGSDDRTNLPQVRANLDDPETLRMAEAFAAPISLHGKRIKGSLRAAATALGKRVLVFEGGEPKRFDPASVQVGVPGVLRVMRTLGMRTAAPRKKTKTFRISRKTRWVRAERGGILWLDVQPGDVVERRQTLGVITDPHGSRELRVKAPIEGMVIGGTVNPLVFQGDAILHLAAL